MQCRLAILLDAAKHKIRRIWTAMNTTKYLIVTFLSLVIATATAAADGPNNNVATSQPDSVRILVAGDSRGKPGFADVLKVAKQMAADRPVTSLITPGDMDPFETTRKQLVEVFGDSAKNSTDAAGGLQWYPVVGNHEQASAPQTMQDFRAFYHEHLAKITNPGPDGTTESTYSFDAGSVHFSILNEYWNGKAEPGSDVAIRDAVVPELRAWLEKDLKASSKPFKIVVGHEPAYPQLDQDFHVGRHADSSLNARTDERDAFWKVLEPNGVTMLLCGHTHRYSRYRPEGSKVWQVDSAQARNDDSWKYDAFVILTATDQTLRMDAYRHLKEQDHWNKTDSLELRPDGTVVSSGP